MRQQTIIWSVLPNGIQSNGQQHLLNFSVLISPRLIGDPDPSTGRATLSQFPDFLDWPRTLSQITLVLKSNQNNQAVSVPFKAVDAAKDPSFQQAVDLWQGLFLSNLPVEAHQFQDYSGRPIRSYPVHMADGSFTSRYQNLTSLSTVPNPDQPPKRQVVHDQFQNLATTSQELQDLHGMVNTSLQANKMVPTTAPQGVSDDKWALAQASAFHQADTGTSTPPPRPTAPMIDFHQLVSSIGQHPSLMRQLYLSLSFTVALDPSVPMLAGPGASLDVWVDVQTPIGSNDGVNRVNHSARTRLDQNGFVNFVPQMRTDPAKAEFDGGRMMKFGSADHFHVTQTETGSSALRVMDFASSVAGDQPNPPVAPPDRPTDDTGQLPATPPMLRSEGIALSQIGLAETMLGHFDQASTLDQSVQQGKPEETILYSEDLVRGYRVDVREESSADPNAPPGPWRSLHRRTGTYRFLASGKQWSLSGSEEGWVSVGAHEPLSPPVPGETRIHETLFRWQGWSLSVPRPGNTILPDGSTGPGNEAPPSQNLFDVNFSVPADGALPKLRFGRTYQIRGRLVDHAGNSPSPNDNDLDQMTRVTEVGFTRHDPVGAPQLVPGQAIVNSPGESVDRMVIRTLSDIQGNSLGDPQPSDRHVAPPKIAPRLAEWHGLFDDPATGRVDPSSYDLIMQQDGYELPAFYTGDLFPLQLPDGSRYLPDVFARGVALAGLPGMDGQIQTVDFWPGTNWPDLRPFRIRLMGGTSSGTTTDTDKRVLTVMLQPADRVEITLGCYLLMANLDKMMVFQWALEQNRNSDPAALAPGGRHWMITPSRILTLVHAVQRPVWAPSFRQLQATRTAQSTLPGQTSAVLSDDVMPIHHNSTEKVDIEAQWIEITDDPILPNWNQMPAHAHVDTIPVPMDPSGVTDPSMQPPQTIEVEFRQEFGDTKYRRVTYQAIGSSRFADYFAAGTDTTLSSAPVTVDILSSAPPRAPEVLYIVPTFEWTWYQQGGQTVRMRKGNGIRMYMSRGWFSSGDGELLGVVLPQGPAAGTPQEQQPAFAGIPEGPLASYVTQWSSDPVWDPHPASAPTWGDLRGAFKRATLMREHLTLREALPDPQRGADPTLVGTQVAVAGHEVQLDTERQLLYCDIEINTGTLYMPFVRLALARYQPNSLANVELSSVVLADFIQLTPDRSAMIMVDPDGRSVTVTIMGTGQPGADQRPVKDMAKVEVELQTRIDTIPDEDLAWRPFSEFRSALTALDPTELPAGEIRWTGRVPLPDPWNRPRNLRLMVREYERHDSRAGALQGERLIYADVLPLFGSDAVIQSVRPPR